MPKVWGVSKEVAAQGTSGRSGRVQRRPGRPWSGWAVLGMVAARGGLGMQLRDVVGAWGAVCMRACLGVVANRGPCQWCDRCDVGKGHGTWGMHGMCEVRPGGACAMVHRCGAWGMWCGCGS